MKLSASASASILSTTPVACSLGSDLQVRIDEWEAALARVERREEVPNGLRLTFSADAPLAELSRLITAEHACCPFFAFALTVDRRGIALEVTSPVEGSSMLALVFGAAA